MSGWNIKTGTLYFHLKELKGLVSQTEDKLYVLTTEGKKLAKWFIGEEDGKAKVSRIDAFSAIAQPVYLKFEQSIFLQIIMVVLAITGLILSPSLDTILLGPMPIPQPTTMTDTISIILNISVVLVQCFLVFVLTKLLGKSNVLATLRSVLLGNGLVYLFIIVVYGLFLLPNTILVPFHLGLISWLIISSITQAFFALVVAGSMIMGNAMKIERSLLVTFILLYATLLIGFILGLF